MLSFPLSLKSTFFYMYSIIIIMKNIGFFLSHKKINFFLQVAITFFILLHCTFVFIFFHVIFFSSFVFKHLSILFWWFFSVYIPNFPHLFLSAVFFLRCVMTILCSVMIFFSIPSSLSSLSLDNSRWLSWHPLSILDFCFGSNSKMLLRYLFNFSLFVYFFSFFYFFLFNRFTLYKILTLITFLCSTFNLSQTSWCRHFIKLARSLCFT